MQPPKLWATSRSEPAAPPRVRRRWIWRLAWLAVALAVLGGACWAGWYAYNRGFSRKWREQLAAELRRRGLDFSATRLTLNPFEGLVAEDAHLYLLDAHHTPLLYINRVAVDISLFNLILKKPFLNSLDLRGARLTLPVDMADPEGPKLKLRRFQAKLAVLPGEVRLTQATGDFYGVQISASGKLLHPESFSPNNDQAAADPQARDRRRQWAHAITDEIEKVRSSGTPPRLEIRFAGDLAHPEGLRASAQLQGDALRRGSYRLERLRVQLDYDAGAFHLQQAELTDAHGTLAARGDFNPSTGDVSFQLQSGLDLLALEREFVGPIAALGDFVFRDTPQLQLDGHARFGPDAPGPVRSTPRPGGAPGLQLTGRLALGRFAYRTFDFDRAETDFSWSGDRWYLRGLRLVRPGGGQQITGDVLSEPGQANVRLTSTVDPVAFAGLLPKKGQEYVSRLEFRDPPRIEFNATGRSLDDPAGMTAKGQLTLGRTRFRGVGLNKFHGDWTFTGRLLSGRNLRLERDEGIGTADGVVYDFDKHEVRIDNARTNLDTEQVGVWLDPDVYHTIVPFRFHKPPGTIINGNVQFDGGRNSHLVTDVNAPGGMDYTFIKKTLPFQSIAGQVVFTEDRLWLNDLHAEIFGGQAQGSLDLALGHVKDYTAFIDVKNIDFARLTKLYFDFDSSKGLLTGDYHFTGRSDDARTLHGMGSLSVDHGNVFAIPFMGPLSGIVSNVLPGLGFDVAHQATVNFLTSDGKIYTGNLDVKGLGFALYGGGWLGYMNDTMNFRVRLNSRGLPGAVLYPVSKLFEYGSQGPLSKPVWRPRVLTVPVPGSPEERKPLTAPPGQTPAVAEKTPPPAPAPSKPR